MSWLFSGRFIDECMSNLQSGIQTEAERASALLCSMSAEEQRQRTCWSENWFTVQAIQAAAHERWLLKNVCSQAPVRQWAKGGNGACHGDGMSSETTFARRRVCSSYKRQQARQQIGKSPVNESCGTLKTPQHRINQNQRQRCEGKICVNLRYLRALVEAFSHLISWDGEQCAQLNVMPTRHKFWRNDRMMEFSKLSQFGLTLHLLTENHGEELLTLYLAAFRAKTSHPQEKGQVSKVNVPDFGQKWHELSVKYDLATCSWKTHQCLFPEDLQESSVTLPKWGMTRNGHVFQHLTLERPISVTESGLWATPAASDSTRGGKITANMTGISLAQQIKTPERWPIPKASDAKRMDCLSERNRKSPCLESTVKMWPTPKASDWNKRGNVSPHPRNGLPGAVMNFPTPTASDANKWSNESLVERKVKGRQIRLNTAVSPEGGNGGRLNPNWVEWLMGWPIGWTDLKPLEVDKFQSWRKAHLNF